MTSRDANTPLVASTRLLAGGESTDYHLTDSMSLHIGEGMPENTAVESAKQAPDVYDPSLETGQPQSDAAQSA